MSYSIDVYVETRPKGSVQWNLVGTVALMTDCQFILINDGEFDTEDIDGTDFFDIDDELSEGLLEKYEHRIDEYIVRQCSLDEYRTRCSGCVQQFEQTFKECFRALGISCELSKRDYVLDLHKEYVKKYTDSGNVRKGYSQVTFPIDKELMIDLNRHTERYSKALMWQGLFQHIDTIRNNEYRLIFVRSF